MRIKIEVKFLGGLADGENLTGSCYLMKIRRGKKLIKIMVDFGLKEGDFKNQIERNMAVLKQVDVKTINYVILTHSHIDHVGRLPLLVKNGFHGKIICTKATSELLPVMLTDSAKIQKNEARYLKQRKAKLCKKRFAKKVKKNPKMPVAILYNMADVETTCELIKNDGYDYKRWIKLDTGIKIKFYPSGHVLGGAICVLEIMRPKTTQHIYIGFSGDLGRRDGIILPPPKVPKERINYWLIESTYGGKKHPERQEEIDQLLNLVAEAVQEKKKIIIPSFALERTQEIIYLLSYFMSIGKIPRIPIYLDSPMATSITKVYAHNWKSNMFKDQNLLNFNPFKFSENHYLKIVDRDYTSTLSKSPGPYIVIAGSGMCDNGKVREYLRENLGNKKTIVCLVGYMAENSLGRKLKDGCTLIKMNGQEIYIKAKIVAFDSLSAHADGCYLEDFTKQAVTKDPNAKKSIFIVHGDDPGGIMLKNGLYRKLPKKWGKDIVIPELNQTFEFAL